MDIEVHTTNSRLMFELFDNPKSVSQGDKREVPGNAELENKGMMIFKSVGVPEILNFSLTFGSGVVAGLVANWLYDKLRDNKVKKLIINRREIHLGRGEIKKVIEEEIEESR